MGDTEWIAEDFLEQNLDLLSDEDILFIMDKFLAEAVRRGDKFVDELNKLLQKDYEVASLN